MTFLIMANVGTVGFFLGWYGAAAYFKYMEEV